MSATGARETILNLFRQASAGYVSGARLSEVLGVSRTAVWKQIEQLRQLGYRIEAIPSRGYRLCDVPDLPLAEELRSGLATRRIGREIRYLAETDSTNRQAYALGEAGADEGLVVIADRQSAGKGRMGRTWASPPGVNLYVSILLRPPLPPQAAPQLTFISTLAVSRAIAAVSGLAPTHKWPNDVLIDGRKVAGLLNELSAESDRIRFVVLGIGVNLNMTAEQFPADLRMPATSLLLAGGRPVPRALFARTLLEELDALYAEFLLHGPAPLLAAWEERCDLVGKPVEVDEGGSGLVRGTVSGIDRDGALLLTLADGSTARILAGDVRQC
ncbi:MAG: biotin--[acetyl-CoA-carboxylase] ligase [Deltaproteobacteria bacterium]|nr:MAG: biotin--[acetyl-CoA-carboxylase] ligase [Deltaproteobacteria bacterium]